MIHEQHPRDLVRARLAEAGLQLSFVARFVGYDYGRLTRILHGYAKPKDGEVEELLAAIEHVHGLMPRNEA